MIKKILFLLLLFLTTKNSNADITKSYLMGGLVKGLTGSSTLGNMIIVDGIADEVKKENKKLVAAINNKNKISKTILVMNKNIPITIYHNSSYQKCFFKKL